MRGIQRVSTKGMSREEWLMRRRKSVLAASARLVCSTASRRRRWCSCSRSFSAVQSRAAIRMDVSFPFLS